MLGGNLCKICRTTNTLPKDEEIQSVEFNTCIDFCDSQEKENDTDCEIVKFNKINNIMQLSSLSPLKYSCSSKQSLSSYAPSTIQYGKRKFKEFITKQKVIFAEGFAPNSTKEFLDCVEHAAQEDNNDLSLRQFKALYVSANTSREKFVIISLAAKDYSRQAVTRELQCSERQFRKARQISFTVNELPISSTPTNKKRMNPECIRHFIDYLFDSGGLQTAAYGTNIFIYESGEKVVVPKPVLSGIRTHVCASYTEFCQNIGFDHLSSSSLMKILKVLKPASKSQLSGLDNVLVEGEDAIETLIDIVKAIDSDRNIILKLRKVETYIKTLYTMRCAEDATCLSHCSLCSLSDPADNHFSSICSNSHTNCCTNCNQLIEVLEEVGIDIEKYAGNSKEDFKFDFHVSQERLKNWMAHNLRGYQQNLSKSLGFSSMSETTFLWIRDWSQKVLPMRFRECQAEYFGKKGMSVHVDVFFRKVEDKIEKYVFLTCVENCKQDLPETLIIAEVALKQLKKQFPEAKEVYTRSDNAGCYSGNGAFDGLNNLCHANGIRLCRIDFSEPQKGKDQADRESAVFKSYMRSYIASGNNVVSAVDLKKSILFRGGPKRVKVAVVCIVPGAKISNIETISQVSKIHSIKFYNDKFKYWNYFNVGEGKEKNINLGTTIICSYSVISDFDEKIREEDMTPRKITSNSLPYYCGVFGCEGTFDTQEDLERHNIIGNHRLIQCLSSMDEVRSTYRQKAAEDIERFRPSTSDIRHNLITASAADNFFIPGWALPIRKRGRLNESGKQFCFEKFQEGKLSGKKYSPQSISKQMREAIDVASGEKRFTTDQYLTINQIKSLLSRFNLLYSNKSYSTGRDGNILNELLPEVSLILII